MPCLFALFSTFFKLCSYPVSIIMQPSKESVLQGKILFTPGHTSDSISLKIGNKIFCGDAAMNGLPSLKRITIWIENKNAFYNSWNILIDEKADWIFPAHGKPFRREELIF